MFTIPNLTRADVQREVLSGSSDVCWLQEMMLLVAGNALRTVERISCGHQITRGFHQEKHQLDTGLECNLTVMTRSEQSGNKYPPLPFFFYIMVSNCYYISSDVNKVPHFV